MKIFEVILPVLIVIGLGSLFQKFKPLNLKNLADLIIYICAPAMIFSMLVKEKFDLSVFVRVGLVALSVIFGVGLIAFALIKIFKIKDFKGLYLTTMFMNSGIIAYPIALFAYGEAGLGMAIPYDIVNTVLMFSLGIALVGGRERRGEALKIPFVYAAVLGIVLSSFNISLPGIIITPLKLLGDATIPLMLLMLGARLTSLQIRELKFASFGTVIRIGFGFLIAYGVSNLLGISGISQRVAILSSSMPSAMTGQVLAEEYDANPDLVAGTIGLSTIVSVITIPFVLWFLR